MACGKGSPITIAIWCSMGRRSRRPLALRQVKCARAVGLAVDNLEVTGALSSASLAEDDLAAGLYDDAEVEIFRVNWADVSERVLMRAGQLGEVKRSGPPFPPRCGGCRTISSSRGAECFNMLRCRSWRCALRHRSDGPAYAGTGAWRPSCLSDGSRLQASWTYESDWFTRGF